MVTYSLDGTPFRVEVRWPKFVLKANANGKNREDVVNDLLEVIAKKLEKNAAIKELKSSLVYQFDEKEGFYTYIPHLADSVLGIFIRHVIFQE